MRLPLVALASAALALATRPPPADACSPPPPLSWFTTLPADGATAIPTNAQIRLDYQVGYEYFGSLDQVTVQPIGGAPIELAISEQDGRYRTLVVARPTAPLAAGTTYEIIIPYEVPCYDFSGGCVIDPHVIGTFTTGAGPDATPPVFEGLDSLTPHWDECDNDACCGPYLGFYIDFVYTAATDDGPAGTVRYNVYEDGTLIVPMAGGLNGWFDCGSVPYAIGPWYETGVASGTPYVVRAVDLAGNEDGNNRGQSVVLDCATHDGGVGPGTPDTGPGIDAPDDTIENDGGVDGGGGGGEESETAGGCAGACAAAGAGGGGFGAALLALATLGLAGLLPRRRRRER